MSARRRIFTRSRDVEHHGSEQKPEKKKYLDGSCIRDFSRVYNCIRINEMNFLNQNPSENSLAISSLFCRMSKKNTRKESLPFFCIRMPYNTYCLHRDSISQIMNSKIINHRIPRSTTHYVTLHITSYAIESDEIGR